MCPQIESIREKLTKHRGDCRSRYLLLGSSLDVEPLRPNPILIRNELVPLNTESIHENDLQLPVSYRQPTGGGRISPVGGPAIVEPYGRRIESFLFRNLGARHRYQECRK